MQKLVFLLPLLVCLACGGYEDKTTDTAKTPPAKPAPTTDASLQTVELNVTGMT